MINRVVLVGRLTRDPELRTTQTGKSVCDFGLAVTKRIKPQDGSPDADFFRVTAWGPTAEYVSNYLHKGRLIGLDGRLQSRRYTASDGSNREVVEVVADNVQALDRPRENGAAAASDDAGASEPAAAVASVSANAVEYDPFADE